MSDGVTALFEIATGVAFLFVLYVGIFARPALRSPAGRLQSFGMLCIAAAFFLFYEAGSGASADADTMLIAGGAVLLLASLLVAVGLTLAARRGA